MLIIFCFIVDLAIRAISLPFTVVACRILGMYQHRHFALLLLRLIRLVVIERGVVYYLIVQACEALTPWGVLGQSTMVNHVADVVALELTIALQCDLLLKVHVLLLLRLLRVREKPPAPVVETAS